MASPNTEICPVCESKIDRYKPRVQVRDFRVLETLDEIPILKYRDKIHIGGYLSRLEGMKSRGETYHFYMLLPRLPRHPSFCSHFMIPDTGFSLVLRQPAPEMGEALSVLALYGEYLPGGYNVEESALELARLAELDLRFESGEEFPIHL